MSRIERIGDATLYLGDCLEIMPTLPKVDAVVTDPPYGIAWVRRQSNAIRFLRSRGHRSHAGIAGDEDTTTRDRALELLGQTPGFVFGSFYAPQPKSLKQVLVWQKAADAGVVGSVTGFRRDVEPVYIVGDFPRRVAKHSSVLSCSRGQSATCKETGHPHTKPLELICSLVSQCPEGTVIDPFMGSGTTGVACVTLARPFIGIEIHGGYFDIACQRIEAAQRQQRLFA